MFEDPTPIPLLSSLAWQGGDVIAWERHFDEAFQLAHDEGLRPALAWTLHDYAEILHDRNQPGDPERAVKMWDESLAIARDLGTKPLVERVIARKKILKA